MIATMVTRRDRWLVASALVPLVFGACDVVSVAQPTIGAPPSRGVLVVDSDGLSTNIAFVGWDGTVSPTLLSSGATPAGLSAALSSDVVVPSEAPRFSGEAVVLDRFASVVTWLDPRSTNVRAQLSVGDGTGNPYDYVEVAPDKAYVLRYGFPSKPGDVLVVDPRAPRIIGTIALSSWAPGAVGAFPARFLRGSREHEVYAILHGFSASYCSAIDARIVRIDTTTDRVVDSVTLPGLKTCSAAARIDAGRFVVACSGLGLVAIPGCTESGGAGLVVLRDDGDAIVEKQRVDTNALLRAPLLESIDVAFGARVVFGTYGDAAIGSPARWLSLDLDVGPASLVELARGSSMSTGAVAFGDLVCEPTRGVCFGADVEAKLVRRFEVRDGALVEGAPSALRDPYGLPPKTFGRLD